MAEPLWALAAERLVRLEFERRGLRARASFQGSRLTSLAVTPPDATNLYIGSRDDGVFASRDGGRTWRRLSLDGSVFSLAVSPADGMVYAGCEPSRLFASSDGGGTWSELDALTRLPSAPTWSFPPRPWTSHVRTIAPNPDDDRRLLVGIELGGVMLSEDGGASWMDHRPGAERDAHELAWHPVRTEWAYEAGGGGTAWSRDGGRTWTRADAGRGEHRYCWALAVDPETPTTWFVSATPDARHAHYLDHAHSRIFRWTGEGPWIPVMAGLPEDPLRSLVAALHFRNGELWAATRAGALFSSPDRGDSWRAHPVEGAALGGTLSLQG